MEFESHIRVQTHVFDLGAEVQALCQATGAGTGAVCTFLGTVRDFGSAPTPQAQATTALELEHYSGMTEKSIAHMVQAARTRFAILGVRIVHRIGRMNVGEPIVLIAVASAHRRESFAACEFLMDYLKTQAPFWKKEHTADGQAHWVDARESDDAALARWGGDLPEANVGH